MPDRRPVSGIPPEEQFRQDEDRRRGYAAFLRDPYTHTTRKTRRNLLLSSVLGIAMVHFGILPTEIGALGIVFQPPDQSNLLNLMGWVIVYFWLSFLLYAWAEHTAHDLWPLDENGGDHPRKRTPQDIAGALRVLFEFLVPIILGLYTFAALFASDVSACGEVILPG